MAPTVPRMEFKQKRMYFINEIGIFRELFCSRSEVFLKFPAPTDLSFSYDFLLCFGESKVCLGPYVSAVLFCFLMTSEHALLIQEDELH